MKKINEVTIYGVLCWNVAIFYRQELVSFFSGAGKIKSVQEFKIKLFD